MARTAALEGFVVAALSAYICNGDSSVSLGQYLTKIVRQMRRQIFRQMKQKAE